MKLPILNHPVDLEKIAWAEEQGRSMARADMREDSFKQEISSAAAHAGMELAKSASPLAGLGATIADLVKKNPGAAIGGGLGLAHGLMKHDGGIGAGLTEGVMGAGLGAGAQHLSRTPQGGALVDTVKDRVMGMPAVDRFKNEYQHNLERRKMAALSQEFGAIVDNEKTAFGAAIAGALRGAVPAITNFVKSNPLKAGLGAAGAISNFSSARKSGEGLGSSLLSGAAGAASAL